jgi:hypothetical protein
MLNNVPIAKPIALHTCTTGANLFFASRPLTNILFVLGVGFTDPTTVAKILGKRRRSHHITSHIQAIISILNLTIVSRKERGVDIDNNTRKLATELYQCLAPCFVLDEEDLGEVDIDFIECKEER